MTLETDLKEKLKRIFNLKVTLADPGPVPEQETLFVNVESAQNTFREARQISRVTGSIGVTANSDKLPLGYFSKCLESASVEDTSAFFFFNFEESTGRFQNIVDRSLGFVFFFDGQYDPAVGTMNELTVESDA